MAGTSTRWKLTGAVHDLDVTRRTVENAESRARLQAKTSASKLSRGNSRQYAQALHRQADELCQRNSSIQIANSGEYESALVLYHRAAIVCPHDSSHSAAARRTAATISSWNNSEKSPAMDDAISRMTASRESVTLKARDASRSFDNLSIIPDVLKNLETNELMKVTKYLDGSRGIKEFFFLFHLRYLDSHGKTSHKIFPATGPLAAKLIRSGTMLKHVNSRANAMLKSLKANFDAGKMRTSLRLAEDLLTLSSGLADPCRHGIPVYRYLALIHAALGRHDRACGSVAKLVRLSRSTGDVVLLSQALMILVRVHLSFGHLEAAARALENLSVHVDHPVPRAWLHHEIGRCHLETGKYVKALRKATQCRECAEEAGSKKWTFHADLLRAQCLAMLGRFAGDDSISQTVVPSLSGSASLFFLFFFFLAQFLSPTSPMSRTKL
ncbi:tetratricopeptide repeat protein 25-like [Monomorium pharaonis]|uniref:tetratricopeptide repeat protein 25-like n=1 Tax=Monomorium pharaonis TaxID=307658 RepID=UPI0017479766|nr:tetratricopeptide repeat protein 25-like [Monomorium pharaonis]